MTRVSELLHRDEFPDLRAKLEATPVPRREFRPAYPGVSRDALRELRAADATPAPTAIRKAFDRPVHVWLPPTPRRVPLDWTPVADDTALNANAAAVHNATDAANTVLDDIAAALNELAAMLAEVDAR